jgi:hypothetical protein
MNPRRFWMMDRLWSYDAGETYDFDGEGDVDGEARAEERQARRTWQALSRLQGERDHPAFEVGPVFLSAGDDGHHPAAVDELQTRQRKVGRVRSLGRSVKLYTRTGSDIDAVRGAW